MRYFLRPTLYFFLSALTLTSSILGQNARPPVSVKILGELSFKDQVPDSYFGSSVAIAGNTIVVGAPGVAGVGEADVFVKPAGGWSNMSQTAILKPSDPQQGLGFGSSVAISGNTIVVGAPDESESPFMGAVYIFVEPSGGWVNMTETAKLTLSSSGRNSLGSSVSISGATIVAANFDVDAAYIFEKPTGGWVNGTETATLKPSDGFTNDFFGNSVSISGRTVVVGAPQGSVQFSTGPGAAYVFVEPAGGWTNANETAKLTIANGVTGDLFGFAVSTNGNTILVGAPAEDGLLGAAHIYVEPSGGWVTTSADTDELHPLNRTMNPSFGESVALSSVALVGAPDADYQHSLQVGSAFVFAQQAGGWRGHTQAFQLNGLDFEQGVNFGAAVALGGSIGVIGEPSYNFLAGNVYIFGQ